MDIEWSRTESQRAAIVLIVALICGLPSITCSGGGGGDNNGLPCTDMSFIPADSTPADGDVFLLGSGATCSTVQVSVAIQNLSGIYTVGFDLSFPSTLLQYQSYTKGPLLLAGSPANAPFFQVLQDSSGHLRAQMSRLNPDGNVSSTGDEVLVTFTFAKVAPGSGTIDFDSTSSSTVSEEIFNASGTAVAASFGPAHGGAVAVP